MYILSVFFSSKCCLFHNSNIFGSCFIHILYTGCAKIKKKYFRRQKVNKAPPDCPCCRYKRQFQPRTKWRVPLCEPPCALRAVCAFNQLTFPMHTFKLLQPEYNEGTMTLQNVQNYSSTDKDYYPSIHLGGKTPFLTVV